MLTDSVNMIAGATINARPSRGSSFPESPDVGEQFYRDDLGKFFMYNGSDWKEIPMERIYDIAGSCIGKPSANTDVMRFVAPRAFSLPASLSGSLGSAGTNATSSVTYSIKKNGTEIGTMQWAGAAAAATFTFASEVSFAVGDVLSVTAPGTVDSTHANFQFTLVAVLA